MTEIVNLRRVRKQRAQAEAAATAAQNRALHGRTGAQKTLERQERTRTTHALDGHRLPPPPRDAAPPSSNERDDPAPATRN